MASNQLAFISKDKEACGCSACIDGPNIGGCVLCAGLHIAKVLYLFVKRKKKEDRRLWGEDPASLYHRGQCSMPTGETINADKTSND